MRTRHKSRKATGKESNCQPAGKPKVTNNKDAALALGKTGRHVVFVVEDDGPYVVLPRSWSTKINEFVAEYKAELRDRGDSALPRRSRTRMPGKIVGDKNGDFVFFVNEKLAKAFQHASDRKCMTYQDGVWVLLPKSWHVSIAEARFWFDVKQEDKADIKALRQKLQKSPHGRRLLNPMTKRTVAP